MMSHLARSALVFEHVFVRSGCLLPLLGSGQRATPTATATACAKTDAADTGLLRIRISLLSNEWDIHNHKQNTGGEAIRARNSYCGRAAAAGD